MTSFKFSAFMFFGFLCLNATAGAQPADCQDVVEHCNGICEDLYSNNVAKFEACIRKCDPKVICDGSAPLFLLDAIAYVPRQLVHSNGKAPSECGDGEQRQRFHGRSICVDSSGDYYYLAN